MSDDAERQKGLVSLVRHELRTPINAIVGYSEMQLDDAPPDLARDLTLVRDHGNRMLARITAALERVNAGDTPLDEALAGAGATLSRELQPLLDEVLERCRARRGGAGGELAADLDRISAAAERLGEVARRLASGGLVTGAEGGPAAAAASAPTEARPEGPRVLVVDDGDANRDLLARQLRKEGYLVDVASNGAEALERVEAERFDLVLLDIMMPVMDGFEALDRLKRDTVLREIPVIVISAADDMENIVRCIARGAEDFLPKPCHNEILRARIRVSLDKRKLRVAERESRKQLQAEMRRTETILRSILPHDVVEELKATNAVQPRRYEHVAVMFLDLVNFTQYCDQQPPDRVVGDLERLVDKLEEIATRHRIEKIKTIGDNFMATGGLRLPLENPVLSCVRCGVEMIEAVQATPPHWNARVGVHAGPVVAGVIGKSKYAFDLWGDTVNTASRVESNGLAGTVNVSGQAWEQIAEHCRGESRGLVRVKGKEALEIIAFKEFLS